MRFVFALLVTLCIGFGASAQTLDRGDLETWLDGYLPYALHEADVAGAVVLVVKDGKILFQKGYGHADMELQSPMDPQRTGVGVGSVSKLFTWTSVMQLVEQGKLDLDKDVNTYLDLKIPDAFGKPITLRHLMTHTAGFEERIKQYVTKDGVPRSLADHLRTVVPPARIYPPGAVPAYSNYGTDIAGYVVERVSGEKFEAYVERHILQPLQMSRSSFRRPLPAQIQTSLASLYGVASGERQPLAVEEPNPSPSGGLVSTAEDMSRFMLAHLQQGRFGEAQILSPATTRLMHEPTYTPMPGAQGVALGFFRGDYNGRRIIQHDGDLSGFHTDLQLLPDENVGFFLCVNSDGKGGGLVGAAYALRASLFHAFMDRYFPAPKLPQEPTLPTAAAHAAQVAGEYEMTRRPDGDFMRALYLALRLDVRANPDGTIETPALLSFETGKPQTWREVAPFTWREVDGTARLNMKVENGRVTAWLPQDLPSAFLVEPVPFGRSAALHLPLLGIAAGVLLLQTLSWPIGARLRAAYARPLALDARARRLANAAAAFGVVYLLGWGVLLVGVSGGVAFDPDLDPWVRLLQVIGLVCVVGCVAALWNARVAFAGSRPWLHKAWSVVVALALLDLAWFSFAFDLISAHLNY